MYRMHGWHTPIITLRKHSCFEMQEPASLPGTPFGIYLGIKLDGSAHNPVMLCTHTVEVLSQLWSISAMALLNVGAVNGGLASAFHAHLEMEDLTPRLAAAHSMCCGIPTCQL